ncbi:response regulator [Mitsuaria sp. WAJ17]|uniref:response regulator n=1 Tax=Mitsuaria sp. WAJ17 TaxID=2761452 RepID=UPI0015FF6D14|nr:response regulator [Mitsuaria sp. WAJ17]MBB2487134.1 response regulator [Mitsuaria sp. WAJ17]
MNAPAPLHFLVVDPLAGVQNFARQLLESYGFPADSIRCCSRPDEALALLPGFRPQFLICDWFPKEALSGIALHRQICQQVPDCRLALLSFETGPEQQAQAQAAGARFLLKKPFTAQELKTTLRQALERLAQERPDLHQRLQRVMGSPQVMQRVSPPIAMPVIPSLPKEPPLKPGDRVRLGGSTEVVDTVVIRHGELVVQLKNKSGLIPADKLQRA